MRYSAAMNEPISIPLDGGDTRPGVLSIPEGEGPFPGVVVIHDIMGMRPDTRRHCERFAAEGYAAIAPDLYDGYSPSCVVKTLLSTLSTEGEGYAIVAAARRALAARPEVDASRIVVMGFCMGGGFALVSAAQGDYVAAAPYYGMVPKEASDLQGLCPVIASFGRKDMLFRSHAARLSRHLEALGVTHEVIVHEDVGHSFMNDHKDPLFYLGRFTPMRAKFDAALYEKSWAAMMAFFEQHMPSAQ